MRQGVTSKNSVSTLFLRREIFMRQSIHLAHFVCDRVQGVERFSTHTRHFPSQVPPPPGGLYLHQPVENDKNIGNCYLDAAW